MKNKNSNQLTNIGVLQLIHFKKIPFYGMELTMRSTSKRVNIVMTYWNKYLLV